MADQTSNRDDDLGPYPTDDRNSELKRLSYHAIEGVLEPQKFIVRRIDDDDRGIDLTIELKLLMNKRRIATGMFAHVQVKGCERPVGREGEGASKCRELGNGEFSYPIPTKNLNLILNTQCPLYILYVHSTRHLYFAWAREELLRLSSEGTDWKAQNTVNLRFKKRLSRGTQKDLASHIQSQSKLSREIMGFVAKKATEDSVSVHVDLKKYTVTDPDEIRELLLMSGMNLVEIGYGAQVLEQVERLSVGDKKLPKILVVRAFAEYTRSRYDQATAHISEAILKSDELSENNREFLDLLQSACDFHRGRITMAEYLARQKKLIEMSKGEFAVSRRIDYLKNSYAQKFSQEDKDEILAELRSTVSACIADEEASVPLKIMARKALVFAEGGDLMAQLMERVGSLMLRLAVGERPLTSEVLGQMKSQFDEWVDKANRLMADAIETKVNYLLAEAIEEVSFIMFVLYSSMDVRGIKSDEVLGHKMIREKLIPNVKLAIAAYQNAENLQGELRSKLILANFHEMLGDKVQAVEIADGVLIPAKAFGFTDLVTQAEDHVRGVPFYRRAEAEMRRLKEEDPDFRSVDENDEMLMRSVRRTVKTFDLPPSALPFVEQEFRSLRQIARERLNHCRYIDLGPMPPFPRSVREYYKSQLMRCCVCMKHGFGRTSLSADWGRLIEAFKGHYCLRCPDRNPKGIGAQEQSQPGERR